MSCMKPPTPGSEEVLLLRLLECSPSCSDSLLQQQQQPYNKPQQQDATQQKKQQQQPVYAVPVVDSAELTYSQFSELFMEPNMPVLIKGACKGWRAIEEWRTPAGQLNIDLLQQLAGHCRVTVTDTACTMTVNEFFEWWRAHKQQQQHYHHHHYHHRQQQQQQQKSGDTPTPLYYLKDWHFVGEFPDYKAYQLPTYFRDDWLNEYYDVKQKSRQQTALEPPQQQQQCRGSCVGYDAAPQGTFVTRSPGGSQPVTTGIAAAGGATTRPCCRCDLISGCCCRPVATEANDSSSSSNVVTSDYRFVYCGPAGSWTPLHSDVLRSYSWSANIVGRKRWWLLPPEHSHLLLDQHGQLPPAFFEGTHHPINGKSSSSCSSSKAHEHVIELVQEAGEVLFVPSGWHHQVLNEADTLSINHNWINAHNVHWSWALLQHEHRQVTELLEDCRETASPAEFEGLVQNMLAANSGFCFEDFAGVLSTIMEVRLRVAAALSPSSAAPLLGPAGPAAAAAAAGQDQAATPAAVGQESLISEQPPWPEWDLLQQQQHPGKQQQQQQQERLALLRCAFDLKRGANVLQQVQHAAIAAAQRNAEHATRQRNILATSQPLMRMCQQSKSRCLAKGVTDNGRDADQRPAELLGSKEPLPSWVLKAGALVTQVHKVLVSLGL